MAAPSGFPGGSVGKESACSAGDAEDSGSIPGSGRFTEGGHGNPLKYSCLENPMDKGAWQATVYGVTRVGYDLVTELLTTNFSNQLGKYLGCNCCIVC